MSYLPFQSVPITRRILSTGTPSAQADLIVIKAMKSLPGHLRSSTSLRQILNRKAPKFVNSSLYSVRVNSDLHAPLDPW